MKLIAIAFLLILSCVGDAIAQCGSAQFQPGQVCGNNGSGQALIGPIAGVDTNSLNSQTTNYTIATTDCGRTVQAGTGSTGLFTVTLPTVTGFDGTCKVTITNGDTVRGKTLSGFPTNAGSILYPLQTVQVEIVNGAWIVKQPSNRWRLTANTTIFFDASAGNNNNDGLASGSGAFATMQKAWDTAADNFDLNGKTLTIQAGGSQTYTDVTLATGKGMVDSGGINSVIIDGASSTATFNQTLGEYLFNIGSNITAPPFIVLLQNFKCTASSGGCIYNVGGQIQVGAGWNFGAVTANHLQVWNGGGQIQVTSPYTISGGAASHWVAFTGGILVVNNFTITCTGTPAFNPFAVTGLGASGIFTNGVVFSGCGGATGARFQIYDNAIIDISPTSVSSGRTYFPGNANGSAWGGGRYTTGGTPILGSNITAGPFVTVLTSGSGTYTLNTTSPAYLVLEMVGGGGGGAGSGTTPGATTAGGNTCWNTSGAACSSPVYAANGGAAGTSSSNSNAAGGTASGCDINLTGGNSGPALAATGIAGGNGGASVYGGLGNGSTYTAGSGLAGIAASANTGSGGGGASSGSTSGSGSGGGAGGYCRKLIVSPASSYTYAVGAAGSGGTLGTGGSAGGNGSAGMITVTEYP